MKKGRPGHVLHVLTDATLVEVQRAEIQRVTGTMGIRATAVERWPVARELDQVTVDGIVVRMKVTSGRAKPEFDDVALVGRQDGGRAARGGQPGRGGLARRPSTDCGSGGPVRLMASADVPLRRGDDRPHPGGLPGTPVHGPGRPRLRRPRRVARRRTGRAHAARGQRRRRRAASSSSTSCPRPWSRATAPASCRSSPPRPPRPPSSSTCSCRARRCTAPPGWRRPAWSWPRTRRSACWRRKPASPRAPGAASSPEDRRETSRP